MAVSTKYWKGPNAAMGPMDFTKSPDPDDPAMYDRHFIRYLAGLVYLAIREPTHMVNYGVYCSPGMTDFQTPETLLKDGHWVICLAINFESDKTMVWFEAPGEGKERFVMNLDNNTWSDFVGWISTIKSYLDGEETPNRWS